MDSTLFNDGYSGKISPENYFLSVLLSLLFWLFFFVSSIFYYYYSRKEGFLSDLILYSRILFSLYLEDYLISFWIFDPEVSRLNNYLGI